MGYAPEAETRGLGNCGGRDAGLDCCAHCPVADFACAFVLGRYLSKHCRCVFDGFQLRALVPSAGTKIHALRLPIRDPPELQPALDGYAEGECVAQSP
ncbi:hypothetical protein NF556_00135 [Ornithinimicrobium faecis]|uniref:Uncharacterized protein n=1 Tax=Ornithinimicrobium faecis TaxID=2934158 RepID=A0ABY4YTN5_9MICO|nr:hypothetical protein [Ornithinimicrobium sp. HY1793]USQ80110.1 hypothetical protein NF556_00135 [Ornithinimicrobium sp. HY1793]